MRVHGVSGAGIQQHDAGCRSCLTGCVSVHASFVYTLQHGAVQVGEEDLGQRRGRLQAAASVSCCRLLELAALPAVLAFISRGDLIADPLTDPLSVPATAGVADPLPGPLGSLWAVDRLRSGTAGRSRGLSAGSSLATSSIMSPSRAFRADHTRQDAIPQLGGTTTTRGNRDVNPDSGECSDECEEEREASEDIAVMRVERANVGVIVIERFAQLPNLVPHVCIMEVCTHESCGVSRGSGESGESNGSVCKGTRHAQSCVEGQ